MQYAKNLNMNIDYSMMAVDNMMSIIFKHDAYLLNSVLFDDKMMSKMLKVAERFF